MYIIKIWQLVVWKKRAYVVSAIFLLIFYWQLKNYYTLSYRDFFFLISRILILISNFSDMNVLFSILLIMNTLYYYGSWHECVVFFQGVHVWTIFTFSLYLHESICAADWLVCCCTAWVGGCHVHGRLSCLLTT